MRQGSMRGLFTSAALAAAALTASLWLAAPAFADVKQAGLVLDGNSGQVLYEEFADAPRHPASLTKMMTLYMVFMEVKHGRLAYDSKITISERAASVAPSKLELPPGDEIEVLDAVKALITKSANDIAVAVAEHIGGTEANFVVLMNARAREIGMTNTQFFNASGLPDDRQVTTARDMVTLGLRLNDEFPDEFKLFSLKEFTYRGKTYRTHNTLLFGFPGMDGIKTGYTRASGFNLVSSVHVSGKHLVGAVFGGTTAATRNAKMRSLLFRSLEKASTERTRQIAKPLPVLVASARLVERPAKPAVAVKPKPKPDPKPAPAVAAEAAAPPPPAAAKPAPAKLKLAPVGPVPVAQPPVPAEAAKPTLVSTGEAPLPPVPRTVSPVRPPSSLDAQAAALADPPAAAPKRKVFAMAGAASGPPAPQHLMEPEASAALRAGYMIQIGAFGSADEADARIAAARSKAAGVLDGHDGRATPAQKGTKQFYRARFLAFDEAGATKACETLRGLSFDCFVMRAE